jgi:hypothetical protein
VVRVEPYDQHDRGLDHHVQPKSSEGRANEAEGPLLPSFADAGQLPNDDHRRRDLDQRVQAEPDQRDRPSRQRGDTEDHHADDVPGQRRVLQCEPSTEEPAHTNDVALAATHRT